MEINNAQYLNLKLDQWRIIPDLSHANFMLERTSCFRLISYWRRLLLALNILIYYSCNYLIYIHKVINMFSSKLLVAIAYVCASTLFTMDAQALTSNDLDTTGLQVIGTDHKTIILNDNHLKQVSFMEIKLSEAVKQQLYDNINEILSKQIPFQPNSSGLSASLDIGMNGVPVFDQGNQSTCVTFANTAAIDAMDSLTDGNSVSQLCNLQLDRTLRPSPVPDVFMGAFGYVVLDQTSRYGYLDVAHQENKGCGGIKAYPAHSSNIGKPMSVDEFLAAKPKPFSRNDYSPLFSYPGTFQPPTIEIAKKVLTGVKRSINKNNRLTFAVILDGRLGDAGAVGTYNNIHNDAYVLTDQIKEDIKKPGHYSAHDMVIYGYDDDACATYQAKDGTMKKQCGLLHLRNSFGIKAGDNGDYYMTYDYFEGLLLEVFNVGRDARINSPLNYAL